MSKRKNHPLYATDHGYAIIDEKQSGLSAGLAAIAPYSRASKAESAIEKNIQVDGAIYAADIHEGGKYRLGDGTVTAPALGFAGSPKTGLYRISANTMGLTVNGTLVATIDSTGIHPIAATAIGPIATDRILGRDTAGSGSVEELTVGGGVEFTGSTGIQTSAFTGDVTKAAGGTALTIANDAVTNGKMADMAQSTIKGRAAGAGTGDPTDLTSAQATAILDLATTSAKGLAPVLSNVATEFLNGQGAYSTPASSSDLVYVATPADTDVSEVTDVTIVSRDVTSVGSTDQLEVEVVFRILNNSAATRVYTITINFDGLFDCELSTGALGASATDEHQIRMKATLSIRSTSESNMYVDMMYYSNTPSAAGADNGASSASFFDSSWDTSSTDVTGTTTVTMKVRSTNANATQTLKLDKFTIRKMTTT